MRTTGAQSVRLRHGVRPVSRGRGAGRTDRARRARGPPPLPVGRARPLRASRTRRVLAPLGVVTTFHPSADGVGQSLDPEPWLAQPGRLRRRARIPSAISSWPGRSTIRRARILTSSSSGSTPSTRQRTSRRRSRSVSFAHQHDGVRGLSVRRDGCRSLRHRLRPGRRSADLFLERTVHRQSGHHRHVPHRAAGVGAQQTVTVTVDDGHGNIVSASRTFDVVGTPFVGTTATPVDSDVQRAGLQLRSGHHHRDGDRGWAEQRVPANPARSESRRFRRTCRRARRRSTSTSRPMPRCSRRSPSASIRAA